MKEISRRLMWNADEGGVACGPCVGVLACDAEIVVEDNGEKVFLHVQWISEADGFHYDATRESIYDVYEKLNNCDFRDSARFDQLIAERNRIYEGSVEGDEKYEKYYKELEQMIMKARKEHEGE